MRDSGTTVRVEYEKCVPLTGTAGRLTILIKKAVLDAQDISHPSFCQAAAETIIALQKSGASKHQCCGLQLLNCSANEPMAEDDKSYLF